MSIEGHKPPRPPFVKDLVATQSMIDPAEHGPKSLGWNQTKHIPDSIGAGLDRTHQSIQSLWDPQFRLNRIEAATVHRKHRKTARPNR
jgi:hypothetical protein